MVDGTCVESMALEVARQHKLPPGILRRASLLYQVALLTDHTSSDA